MPDIDLEELKRLVAEARLPLKHERTEYASMITDGTGRTLLGVSRSYMEHVGDCEAHLDLFVAAVNALPELIAAAGPWVRASEPAQADRVGGG